MDGKLPVATVSTAPIPSNAACLKQMLTVRYSHLAACSSNRRRGSRIAISFRGRCHLVHPHHQFNSSRLASVGPSKQRTRGGQRSYSATGGCHWHAGNKSTTDWISFALQASCRALILCAVLYTSFISSRYIGSDIEHILKPFFIAPSDSVRFSRVVFFGAKQSVSDDVIF